MNPLDVSESAEADFEALCFAVLEGRPGLLEVKRLVQEEHVDVNYTDENGITPLYVASQNDQMSIVKYLIQEAKANVNQARDDGSASLFTASDQGYLGIVKYLVQEGKADVNQANQAN